MVPPDDQAIEQSKTAGMWPIVEILTVSFLIFLVLVPNVVFLCGHCNGRKNRLDARLRSYLLE